MKRLHVHVKTRKLKDSIDYYTALFGTPPETEKHDYARWLLDEPPANISLSTHCSDEGDGAAGIDHVGVSVDDEDSLEIYADRLAAVDATLIPEKATTCCYAQSNKYWTTGPQGERWELFQTFGDSEAYGAEPPRPPVQAATGSKSATGCC